MYGKSVVKIILPNVIKYLYFDIKKLNKFLSDISNEESNMSNWKLERI